MIYDHEWREDRCHECDEACYSIYLPHESDKWTEVVQYDCDYCGRYVREHDSLALTRAIEERMYPDD